MQTRNSKLHLREGNSSRITIVSNSLLIIGTSITLAAVIYMIINLNKADSIITMWLTVMAVGILLSFCGLIIRLLTRSSERKNPYFYKRNPYLAVLKNNRQIF